MHISLGRRNNHVTILQKFGVYFGVLHAMVHLDADTRTTDGQRTDGQRTDMNEVGSLYIGAFGTKNREKNPVSLVNAKSSDLFDTNDKSA